MKKILILVLSILFVSACSSQKDETKVLKVSATSIPHSEILNFVKPILKEEYNINLEVNIVDDYFIPNKAVDTGDIDANYFQHIPFFEEQINTQKYQIENAGGIHIEPIGIYSKKYKSKEELKNNSTILITNSVADHGRILALLETAGLIELDPKVDKVNAKLKDIVKNPKNLTFKPDVDAAFTPKALENNEADLVAINSNFALEAGLNPLKDSIILESGKDNPYVNIVATKKGHKDDENIVALVKTLQSQKVKDFILEKYQGSVIPAN